MNTGLWKMGSGFAAARRPGMTSCYAKFPAKAFAGMTTKMGRGIGKTSESGC